MRVLFIGGTGNISTLCVERALDLDMQVSVLNRGQSATNVDPRVEVLISDRNDAARLTEIAAGRTFDVVANFVGFTPDQVAKDIAAFQGKIGQYVYISSATVYQKPANHYVITEATPLNNPFWQYARDKIACEDALRDAYRNAHLPITIVRPSYTYGPTWVPTAVGGHGYTVIDRIRRGQAIVSHGDGQSLWQSTAAADFAVGFVGLFGRAAAIGEAFHITTDEVLTWDSIYRAIGAAAGREPIIAHVTSDTIRKLYPRVGDGLLGDKANSVVFDNSKIKRVVPEFAAVVKTPFAEGMRRSVAWYDADPARQVVDPTTNTMIDDLLQYANQ